jgi:DNA polymerase III, gamma/tau subunits
MLIARAAEGGMRDALSILDMCLGYSNEVDEALVRSILGTSDSSFLFEFCDALTAQDAQRVFSMIDQLMREGKDPSVFAKDVSRHIRAMLIAKTCPEDIEKIMDITQEEAEEYRAHSREISVSRLMKTLDMFMSLETEMRYSSTPRMALENLSLKCCLRLNESDPQALADRISELEHRIELLNDQMKNIATGSAGGTGKAPALKEQTAEVPAPPKNRVRPVSPNASDADAQTVWKQFMNMIRSKDITVWSFLSQGKLVSCKEGQFVWQSDDGKGSRQYISILNKPEKKQAICDCLQEITGHECSFIASDGENQPSADSGDDEYMQRSMILSEKDRSVLWKKFKPEKEQPPGEHRAVVPVWRQISSAPARHSRW